MSRKLIVASGTEISQDENIETSFLVRNNFYKILSLVEASRAGVQVPSTLLLLEMNKRVLDYVIKLWNLPLMIRMEFKSLPVKKTLGGILLYSCDSLSAVAEFLFQEKCYPVFHNGFDRFKNVYSVGVMIEPGNSEVQIEVVGRGFDASDLRLNLTKPHEHIKLDVLALSISERSIISHTDYLRWKTARIERVRKLVNYVKYVNEKGVLLPTLDLFNKHVNSKTKEEVFIADNYTPLPASLLHSLGEIAWLVYAEVVKHLPNSKVFIASLSYFEDAGWILWDIYGQWYRREEQTEERSVYKYEGG